MRDLLAREAPIERVRKVMESDQGVDRGIHRALGDQGIAGLLVPEEHGGIGLGLLDAAVAAQELGRGAAPVSFHSSYVMAPLLLAAAGSDQQKREWLPKIAEGAAIVAVALDEAAHDGGAAGRRRTTVRSRSRAVGCVEVSATSPTRARPTFC